MIDTFANLSGAISDSILRQTLRHAVIGVAWLNCHGQIVTVNPTLSNWLDTPIDELAGDYLGRFVPKLDESHWSTLWGHLTYSPLNEPRCQLVVERSNRLLDMLIQRLPGEEQDMAVVYLSEVQNPRQQNALHNLQTEVLEAVAQGKSLQESTDLLCRRVESIAPDVICTVLQIDSEGLIHTLAAPSMPAAYTQAINNSPIGPKAGSCGTAAYRGEPVEVIDIASDPLWEDYRNLALPLGLKACWSSPIKSREGTVSGTFALYYREPRGASQFHRQLVNACVHLCSLAINHHESESRIHQLAFFDSLTQLPNRTLLSERARHELFHAARAKKHLAVLFLDVDRFKHVNDSLGHLTGDELLQILARRLECTVRESDTVSRLGGDEFLILLPECSADHARGLVEKILAAISVPMQIGAHLFTPTASIGISIYPQDGTDFDELLQNADTAMYQAKAGGRNRFHFFRPEMNIAANEYLALEAALRQAISGQEIKLVFQPKININQHQMQGLEVLARWQHPTRGAIPPSVFIPLAEESGLIDLLDHLVMRKTCEQLSDWRRRGIQIPNVAVNVSAVNFRDLELATTLRNLLEQFQIPPSCLTLEITESLIMLDSEAVMTNLRALRALGIDLAVDDFGTGFSSLSYLHRFPVNELKLDQSFVRELGHKGDSRALASAIIGISEALHLTLVAEGVETEEQLEILRDEGCNVVQGFYFAHPMEVNALEQWMVEF